MTSMLLPLAKNGESSTKEESPMISVCLTSAPMEQISVIG